MKSLENKILKRFLVGTAVSVLMATTSCATYTCPAYYGTNKKDNSVYVAKKDECKYDLKYRSF